MESNQIICFVSIH